MTTARRADGQPGADSTPGAGHDVLFLVGADGQLTAATQAGTPAPRPGDTVVFLGPVPVPITGRQRARRAASGQNRIGHDLFMRGIASLSVAREADDAVDG